MYKINFLLLLNLLFVSISCAQEIPTDRPHCSDQAFDQKVSKTINFTVPLIGVEELKEIQNEVYIFDTRKKEEYNLSHIKGAKYLGYKDFDPKRLSDIPKNSKIVVYCSIGYRSEKIGEKLQSLGYTNVYNLYGSLFDWVNRGNPVFKSNETKTRKVHTYNKDWSRWVINRDFEKIW